MATKRQLTRAPIQEALIDIQFSPHIPFDEFVKLREKFASEFPDCKNIWQASVGFDVTEDLAATTQKNQIGYRFESQEHTHILQCRTNGFTFSRLSPYETWEQMRDEAKELWEQFITETRPGTVSRLAVRYINALRIPLPIDSFSTYLAVPPELPAALPQTLAGFLQRFVIARASDGCTAVVTQALEESNVQLESDAITVFLDIDVFKIVELQPDAPEIWQILEVLRNFKNDVFFEYLTEKSVESYQ